MHIILRSGGSITTMVAGYLWGKRYSRVQIIAVLLLTVGVILAAWSDAQSQVATNSQGSVASAQSTFGMGLIVLFVAQVLSAIMGLYTEETYKKYGSQWRENMFYTHALSLPLFLPFLPSMVRQAYRLAQSPPLFAPAVVVDATPGLQSGWQHLVGLLPIPSQIAYLAMNVLTQYACIRGVNLLAAVSSALTVTIVLNIRKLASLLLSIWLFGNRLAMGTLLGAVIVFGSGALYSLESRPSIAASTRKS
jgi:UDP-xylose/UDP-N-acetylglucosamine transporter B4